MITMTGLIIDYVSLLVTIAKDDTIFPKKTAVLSYADCHAYFITRCQP